MTDLEKGLKSLSPEQRALVLQKLRTRNASKPAPKPDDTRNNPPLSYAQQRLWLEEQIHDTQGAYNIPSAFRFRGNLRTDLLETALNTIIARHEVLRTCFRNAVDGPECVVSPAWSITLPIIDLSGMPLHLQEMEIWRYAKANATKKFDLQALPLLQITLLRIEEHQHILLSSIHHAISDGWSTGIFVRELCTIYQKLLAGQKCSLPPLPAQYKDFAVWQRNYLEAGASRQQLSYWRKQLENAPGDLNLRTDRPRAGVRTYNGSVHRFQIDREVAALVRTISEHAGSTPFIITLAAFALLLSQHAQQEDLLIAVAVANRNKPEFEPLIGYFVNTIFLRVRLCPESTFTELLADVRTTALDSFSNQDVPFEQITAAMKANGVSHTPTAQVGFALQTFSIPSFDLPGVQIEAMDIEVTTSKAEFSLLLAEGVNGLTGTIEYNSDLFFPDAIASIATDYKQLLATAVSQPDRTLQDIAGCIAPASQPQPDGGLTQNQMLVWLGQQLHPNSPLYNNAFVFYIDGELDRTLFDQAFQTLVNSSDAFRTIFEGGGTPVQRVLPNVSYPVQHLDFSNSPDARNQIEQWARARIKQSFDLSKGSFDTALVRLDHNRFAWYIGFHHMVMDGVSSGLVFQCLSDFYAAAEQGQLRQSEPLPPFSEYIAFEHQFRQSAEGRRAARYWAEALAIPADPLVFYGKAAKPQNTGVETIFCPLGAEASSRLRQAARQIAAPGQSEHRMMFQCFGALLCAFVHRTSGAVRIGVGVAHHNRRSNRFKSTIGLFMEVLPLQVVVDIDGSIPAVFHEFGSKSKKAFQHLGYTVGNPHHQRAYDVFLNYQVQSYRQFFRFPAQASYIPTHSEEDALGLHVLNYDDSGEIVLQLNLHRDIFDVSQSAEAVKQFRTLIDEFIENPFRPLRDVSLLSNDEKHRVLYGFNETQKAFPAAATAVNLFEACAQEHPLRDAATFGSDSISYLQLNARANQLAHALSSLHLAPETLVAIYLTRGIGLLVAVLGVLKAGCAYVPVDADVGNERIRYLIHDSQAPVIITVSNLRENLPGGPQRVICLDSEAEWLSGCSEENCNAAIKPDQLAYAIYTSGSTGRPKAAMISHRSLANSFFGWKDAYNLGAPILRHAQMASFSFDVFTGDFVRALCSGGTLILCPRDLLLEPAKLYGFIQSERIECAEFVPAVLRSLFSYAKAKGGLGCVRICIAGSDVWSVREYRELQSLCGSTGRAINSYGLTEAAIDSTYFESNESNLAALDNDANVPIGRPFANTQAYVLDGGLRPVPVGVPGELYIGGAGLARGYLRDPRLTADRFIPNPYGAPGSRLYRTGDAARIPASGNVELLGRVDYQVKIRGFRVEPREIELAIQNHPGIRHAVVTTREGGSPTLVAFVVPQPGSPLGREVLHHFLKPLLPGYMLPSRYVFLDDLPLTTNGKIDRKALHGLLTQAQPDRQESVLPRNREEQILAGIWSEVLRIDTVGIDDDFFQIGGHSLLAAQVMTRIRSAFQVDLPLRALFEEPTISGLVKRVARLRSALETVQLVTAGASAHRIEGEL